MKHKQQELRAWVEANWPDLSLNDFTFKSERRAPTEAAPAWQALPGDAGFRHYFRLASEPPLLAVYAPPETEKNQEFLHLGRALRQAGVLAPAIAKADLTRGFFLIEDFGPTLLLDILNTDNAEQLYRDAIDTLIALQRCPADASLFARYDRAKLRDEMQLMPQWFATQLLGLTLEPADETLLAQTFGLLEDAALAQPQVVVHRDYHSRNLVYRPDGPPGVIDFQDAVIGPVTYDLVSLLRDCYIEWPAERVAHWLQMYLARAQQAGLLRDVALATLQQWFDWMGLQRHIKVLGIFARLSLRDAKHGYLKDLPLVVRYVTSVAARYPELAPFQQWFSERVQAPMQNQPWWRNAE